MSTARARWPLLPLMAGLLLSVGGWACTQAPTQPASELPERPPERDAAAVDPGPSPAAVLAPGTVTFTDVLALPAASPDTVVPYGEGSPQFAEVWLPVQGDGPAPVVVLVHGGCWLNVYGVDHVRAVSAAWAGAGWAVWSLEYRRLGDEGGGWPGSFDDIMEGLRSLAAYDGPLDRSRVVLVGHSAGGHLALLAGSAATGAPIAGLTVRGVVGLAAIVDLATYAQGGSGCQQAAARFMGAGPAEAPDLYAQANPIDLPAHPQTVLVHGTADPIVPIAQADTSPWPVERLEGAGHFDLIHPGTSAWTRVVRVVDEVIR